MTSSKVARNSFRAGFSLLEVLLTSLLASVVLVALWSLSDIYLKMFATGKKKIEETQLVRGLTDQLAKDVSQIIQLTERRSMTHSAFQSQSDFNRPFSPNPVESGRSSATRPGESPVRNASSAMAGSRTPSSSEQRGDGGRRSTQTDTPPAPRSNLRNAASRGPNQNQDALGSVEPGGTSRSAASNSGFAPTSQRFTAGRAGFTAGESTAGLPQRDRMVPAFGLLGTTRSLRLIVLQADPQRNKGPTDLADVIPLPGQARSPLASEIKAIQYSFALPTDSPPNETEHPPGLIRREWAWETWSGFQALKLTDVSANSSASDLPEWTSEDALAFERGRDVHHVPQVKGIEFRYYDGFDWEYEWDSEERQALPVLIEVLFKIRTTGESDVARSDESDDVQSDESTSSSDDSSSSWSAGAGTVYRQLIHLPFSEESPAQSTMAPFAPPVQASEVAGSPAAASPVRSRQR